MTEEKEQEERREKAARDLSGHDRMVTRSAAHAARDTLQDASAHHEPGAYTTYEARNRAAHTPSILDRDGPRDREDEAQMIEALHKGLFTTDCQWEAYRQQESAAESQKEAHTTKDFQARPPPKNQQRRPTHP